MSEALDESQTPGVCDCVCDSSKRKEAPRESPGASYKELGLRP